MGIPATIDENPQDDCCMSPGTSAGRATTSTATTSTSNSKRKKQLQLHHRHYHYALGIDDDDYGILPTKRPLKHRKSSKRSKRHHSHHHRNSTTNHNNNNKPHRLWLYLRHRLDVSTCSLVCISLILTILTIHRLLSVYMTHRKWINAPITYMERTCPAPPYQTLASQQQQQQQQRLIQSSSSSSSLNDESNNHNTNSYNRPRICLTTLTDAKSPSKWQRLLRWRNFDGILELTWKNKYDYARKHGYDIYDGSDLLDPTRPPAWTKIKAVQYLLSKQQEQEDGKDTIQDQTSHNDNNNNNSHKNACDWVMWTDADTIIMNSDITIESFLPADTTHDLLIGSDNGGGYNSGVFLFRNTAWSKQFLDTWWNMDDFVRPPGFSLSGDNLALKTLLRDYVPQFHNHVLSPARCILNSFAKFLTLHESRTIMDRLEQQEWYLSENYYHRSDFLAHTPGYDNKEETLRLLLQEAT